MFKTKFGKYVCEGDSITCEVDGFTATATLYRDECQDRPDERMDGFWPSLNPKDAGWIGLKSKRTLARKMAKATAIMKAWERDEWHYFGVDVTVKYKDVHLTTKYGNALWGIEGNYPGSDNSYFTDVANDLLGEALAEAKGKLVQLCEAT